MKVEPVAVGGVGRSLRFRGRGLRWDGEMMGGVDGDEGGEGRGGLRG